MADKCSLSEAPLRLPSLGRLQSSFQRNIIGHSHMDVDDKELLPFIIENGIPAGERLDIYRNNSFITLREALKATFPVVCQLGGEDFFNMLAAAYIRQCPPAKASLIFYGDRFAALIDEDKRTASIPYLGDVARLEWAWHCCYHGQDDTPLVAQDMQTLDDTDFPEIHFKLLANRQWVKSNYPVLHIWQIHQEPDEGMEMVSLEEGGCDLLVMRHELDIQIVNFAPDAALFLRYLDHEKSLADATQLTQDAYAGFDLQSCLQEMLTLGVFSQFYFKDRRSQS
ncbi:MAG: hypothetical protein CMF31_08530 [Kordiimonas sp.]|nr:hypothetical protein [Kordiimonas sp.]|tara:strand:- start:425 stop:1270 length:846 start_codon:yes stop_codon:yes gene_type:complete